MHSFLVAAYTLRAAQTYIYAKTFEKNVQKKAQRDERQGCARAKEMHVVCEDSLFLLHMLFMMLRLCAIK